MGFLAGMGYYCMVFYYMGYMWRMLVVTICLMVEEGVESSIYCSI